MADRKEKTVDRENLTKLVLILLFLGGLALFIGWMSIYGPGWDAFQLRWLDIVLLGLATYRLGRLIAYDRVMEPLRLFFTETVPDPTGAGETVEPKGEGVQQAIGQLICCPICAGTWVAALLVYTLYLFPGPTRLFLTMTSAIAIGEILNAVTEAFSWSGQYSRVMSGSNMRARQQPHIIRIDQPCEDALEEPKEKARVYQQREE